MKVFDAVKGDFSKLGASGKGLGENIANAFKSLGGAGAGIGSEASFLSRTLLLPVRAVATVVRWPIATASWMYKAAPVPMALATIGAGILGVKSFVNGRAEAKTQRMLQAQALEAQAIASQAQMAAPQPSYMNSASQADVDARIAADVAAGKAPAGAAAALAARQQVPAPEAARA